MIRRRQLIHIAVVVLTTVLFQGCGNGPLLPQEPFPTPTAGPIIFADGTSSEDGPPKLPPQSRPNISSVCKATGTVIFLSGTATLYGQNVVDAMAAFSPLEEWYECSPRDAEQFLTLPISDGDPRGLCYPAETEALRDAMEGYSAFGTNPMEDMLEADRVLCSTVAD